MLDPREPILSSGQARDWNIRSKRPGLQERVSLPQRPGSKDYGVGEGHGGQWAAAP